MEPRAAAMARWTGRGDFQAFRRTVEGRLGGPNSGTRLRKIGFSLAIEGLEPLGTATKLQHLPGLAWLAVGFSASSLGELGVKASILAPRYLRGGERFSVAAEASGAKVASDVSGAVTSAVLGAVRGARTSEGRSAVRFRAALDGARGIVGIEVREGPGGEPTGKNQAACLVSGGRHSSVVAWMALLGGYRVLLLHAKESEGGLREVAKLYSELSHRVDPRTLRLQVLEGKGAGRELLDFPEEARMPVFAGFHKEGDSQPPSGGRLSAPLYLLPESDFELVFRGLSLRGHESTMAWTEAPGGEVSRRSFGGVEAEASEVLGGLALQRSLQ